MFHQKGSKTQAFGHLPLSKHVDITFHFQMIVIIIIIAAGVLI